MKAAHPLCGSTDDMTTEETTRRKPELGTTPCIDPAIARNLDKGPREGNRGRHTLLVVQGTQQGRVLLRPILTQAIVFFHLGQFFLGQVRLRPGLKLGLLRPGAT